MAAHQGPRKKTASRCAPETEQCTHVFEIAGYSLLSVLGAGEFIRSATFAVGGHDWSIRFYPQGNRAEENQEYVTLGIELNSKLVQGTKVRVLCGIGLVDPITSVSSRFAKKPSVFSSERIFWHTKGFKKSQLEAPRYLQDDRLVIECDITVMLGMPVLEPKAMYEIQVPPSDLSDNLGKLLETRDGADVIFKVKGEIYHAHKIVLAMRSPVFKAELYGPLGESNKQCLTIEDMQPSVFMALLHFIYTDTLPSMDDLDADENEEMVKHLLVAADRYAMERMKLICESILCKRLNVERVATTLALADQHHCIKLKDACIGFINSLNRMDDVVKSQGYEHLKRACPAVFVEIWEKASKSRKI
ncbi:hypothetical protein ACP70R_003272 [Stipagrostis hirtigluma subsp. patula]